MSEPQRYKVEELKCCFDAEMIPSDSGEYVRYADYAALKAETVKRLEETIPPVEAYIVELEAENQRLRGQVEHYITALGKQELLNQRLVKTGDDMASKITFDAQMEDEDWGVDTGLPESVKAWRAAKGEQP